MPRIGACCELSRCEPVEARVRSVGVVVDPPFFDDLARLVEVGEQVLVEALITQAAVEAFHDVNGPRNLLTLGRAIFPTWRGRRSAVCLISASVFRGSTTALDRGGRGRWLDQSIGADVLRNEIGVLTKAIA